MNIKHMALVAFVALSACGGDSNPFDPPEEPEEGDNGGGTGGGTGNPIGGDPDMPPGTESPSPSSAIYRQEPRGGSDRTYGNGFATNVVYNAANDTFSVDNIGFDGSNAYERGTAVSSMNGYAVYEAASQVTDPDTNRPINQLSHRAIYGVSPSQNTQFAIVRTGAYSEYGFGGFVYQRNNGVNLPSSGQALYTGKAAGIRDYTGKGGMDYTTADLSIAIDFDDFNETTGGRGDAVRGHMSNRRVFDINGTDITDTVLQRINTSENINLTAIPTSTFVIEPNALDANGEITGDLISYYVNSSGDVATFETGNYYAIVSGDNAEEIVGVMVLESTVDPIAPYVRDTSGFIVYR